MIAHSLSATGAALAVLLLIACRDAPTVPLTPVDYGIAPSLSVDSVDDMPAPASIRNPYTRVSYYDGSYGGEASMEILTGMDYIGNRASLTTNWEMRGTVSRSNRIFNEQDSFYNPFLWKHWNEHYYVPTGLRCGFSMEAHTEHAAWWAVWVRISPNYVGNKELKFTRDGPVSAPPCDHGPHPDDGDNSGGGGGSGGSITIETCHYWAHYVGGVLVDIELRYCEYDLIPVADE